MCADCPHRSFEKIWADSLGVLHDMCKIHGKKFSLAGSSGARRQIVFNVSRNRELV
jgi:hypothetical protein